MPLDSALGSLLSMSSVQPVAEARQSVEVWLAGLCAGCKDWQLHYIVCCGGWMHVIVHGEAEGVSPGRVSLDREGGEGKHCRL